MDEEKADKEDTFTEDNYDLEMIIYADTPVASYSNCHNPTPPMTWGLEL